MRILCAVTVAIVLVCISNSGLTKSPSEQTVVTPDQLEVLNKKIENLGTRLSETVKQFEEFKISVARPGLRIREHFVYIWCPGEVRFPDKDKSGTEADQVFAHTSEENGLNQFYLSDKQGKHVQFGRRVLAAFAVPSWNIAEFSKSHGYFGVFLKDNEVFVKLNAGSGVSQYVARFLIFYEG